MKSRYRLTITLSRSVPRSGTLVAAAPCQISRPLFRTVYRYSGCDGQI